MSKLLEAAKDILEMKTPIPDIDTDYVPRTLIRELAAAVAEAEADERATDVGIEILLDAFGYHLRTREYFGAMSDSPGPWRQEERDKVTTEALAKDLADLGFANEVEALWDEIAPKPYTRPLLKGGSDAS